MKYVVSVHEVTDVDNMLIGYEVDCIDELGVVVRHSEVYDNLQEAINAFAELQYRWWNELNVPANQGDAWTLKIDLSI